MLSDAVRVSERINAAATTNDTVYLPVPSTAEGGKWFAKEIGIVPNATLALHASNFSTLTFTGNDGSTSLGTITSETVAMTAGTRRTISPSGSASVWLSGTTTNAGVKVAKTHSGTGGAVDVVAYVVWEKVREA